MWTKWHKLIWDISNKYGVDTGVGFEMMRAIYRGGDYGDGLEFDKEELLKDCEELLELAKK